MPIVIAALILLIVVILIRNIRIVQQAKAYQGAGCRLPAPAGDHQG